MLNENIKVLRLNLSNFSDSKIKAFCDISYYGLKIKGFKVVDNNDGLFVGMPREKGKDEKWYNTIEPNDLQTKMELEQVILKAYKDYISFKKEGGDINANNSTS